MKTIREFAPADRYVYDFGACSIKNGFAQVDTEQDASYYGTWANPSRLVIVCYCEGDVTTQIAASPAEFAAALRTLKEWNENNGWRFIGIDPGFDENMATEFKNIGLGDLLHTQTEATTTTER